jgi:transposase InsO family protein
MSQLRKQLKKILPRLSGEANKLRDPEARSRWMKIKQITESPKSLSRACAFYGLSMDAYGKWGNRLCKQPGVETLLSRSRKPYRSPNKTKPRKTKKVMQLRRQDPHLGPERISYDLKQVFNMNVPPSTVYAILKREKLVSQKQAAKLTKKHLKRYRRVLPGYLQMDFKYVPYKVNGEQFYQLSCVDHHSSWRLIRVYGEKNLFSVMSFLKLLIKVCPFPILEIQTDNDAAFTDKFISGVGVTGEHEMDLWCSANQVRHKLIPVGVKELNGKVENTHKQDDREFYAKGPYKDFKNIRMNIKGYNERWNLIRRTKTLGWKSPDEVVQESYVRSLGWLMWIKGVYPQTEVIKSRPKKIRTRKNRGVVRRYLQFLEWESKNKAKAVAWLPTMSQNFSAP